MQNRRAPPTGSHGTSRRELRAKGRSWTGSWRQVYLRSVRSPGERSLHVCIVAATTCRLKRRSFRSAPRVGSNNGLGSRCLPAKVANASQSQPSPCP